MASFYTRVAAQRFVVALQPGGHRQQLLNSDPGEAGIGVLGKLGGQQLTDSLIQALDLPLGDGDPDQRADDTLGHRPDVMTVGRIQTLPIVFVDADNHVARSARCEHGDKPSAT